jgi:hypothetical protein
MDEAMPKIPVGLRVDADLMERVKNAVWHLGHGLTITAVLEEALADAVARLESQNGGKPFAPRGSDLPKSPKKK